MRTLTTILFDYDDTLNDTTSSRPQRARLCADKLVALYPNLDANDLIQRMLAPVPGVPGAIREVMPVVRELGLADSPALQEAVGPWYFKGHFDLISPWPGTEQAIRELAGSYRLGIITNGIEAVQRSKLEALPFRDCFGVFLSSERAGVEKPDPAIFAQGLSEAGSEPRDALYIGNSLEVDVAGALASGMRAVWFDCRLTGMHPLDPRPTAIMQRFEDLPALVHALD